MSWVVDLVKELIPPSDADPAHTYRYRLTTSLWILAMTLGGGLHIAMVCGYLTMFFPGFANADQLAQTQQNIVALNKRIDAGERYNLGVQLFTLREKQCKAPSGSKDVYTEQLNEAYQHYLSLSNGQLYRLPACEEF